MQEEHKSVSCTIWNIYSEQHVQKYQRAVTPLSPKQKEVCRIEKVECIYAQQQIKPQKGFSIYIFLV